MINRYVALDIETTGLNPAVDRIIEVGMARVEAGNITQKYSELVYPGITVSDRITELTGIQKQEPFCKITEFSSGKELLEFQDETNAEEIDENTKKVIQDIQNDYNEKKDEKINEMIEKILR